MNGNEITVATWNTAWAPTSGRRGPLVRERLADTSAGILVVTEGSSGLLPDGGYVVDAGNDWGYDDKPRHRKVLLWSRWPLTDVNHLTDGAGSGRVMTALTDSPVGGRVPWGGVNQDPRIGDRVGPDMEEPSREAL
ncbi:hypothetical protein [Rhodococcus wratislaviensis]|uniref:hypothetical protein n=1 Tax=Rhodococcus wratislaviensis TaxID=44752 RepID=UPI00366240CB